MRARSARSCPTRSASTAESRRRPSPRSAWITGPYGNDPSPSSMQPPTSTKPPASLTWSANRVTSRVLPTPASPPTQSVTGSPPRVDSNAACSRPSSPVRPMKWEVATLPAMARSMPRTASDWNLLCDPGRVGVLPHPPPRGDHLTRDWKLSAAADRGGARSAPHCGPVRHRLRGRHGCVARRRSG